MQNRPKIAKEFDKLITKACEEQPLKDFLEDEIEEDCSGLDFDDTSQLFDKYEDECLEWLDFFFKTTGLSALDFCIACDWDFFIDEENDKCLIVDSDKNKFLLVTSMFEHYCIEIYNNMNVQNPNK